MIIPASIRNLNPGAQYPGPSAKKFGGIRYETLISQDGEHKIATFPSSIQGAAAMFDLLANGKTKLGRYQYRNKTVADAIKTRCGAFYVSTYIKVLEEKGGVKRSDPLTIDVLKDPSKAIPLARAMAWQEAGRDYPMTEAEWLQAHTCAFQQQIAPAFSPENDVPSPKAELRQAETIAKVGKVAGVVTATGGTVASIPAPPTAILDAAGAWKAFSVTALEFGAFAVSSPKSIVVIAVAGAAMWFGPRIAPKLFGGANG